MQTKRPTRPRHKGSPRLFDNPLLERMTHTHIAVPLLIFGATAAVLFYYGIFEKGFEMPLMILLFFGGLLFFTLLEYFMHRYLYHLPATTKRRKKSPTQCTGCIIIIQRTEPGWPCRRYSACSSRPCYSSYTEQ